MRASLDILSPATCEVVQVECWIGGLNLLWDAFGRRHSITSY